MVNQFAAAKQDQVDADELSRRSLKDYETTGKRLAAEFGRNRLLADIGTDDFAALRKKLAKQWGPATLSNEIQRVRVFFNYAFKKGMIEQPMRYGAGFDRPSKKVLRKARAEKEEQVFEAYEIRAMINGALAVDKRPSKKVLRKVRAEVGKRPSNKVLRKARAEKEGPELVEPGQPLKAMILLGINCGFGNADCGTLRMKDINLETGLIDYVRQKTGILRRCPLWPETVAAIRETLADRPAAKDEPADPERAVGIHYQAGR